jgi:hypothetical protein
MLCAEHRHAESVRFVVCVRVNASAHMLPALCRCTVSHARARQERRGRCMTRPASSASITPMRSRRPMAPSSLILSGWTSLISVLDPAASMRSGTKMQAKRQRCGGSCAVGAARWSTICGRVRCCATARLSFQRSCPQMWRHAHTRLSMPRCGPALSALSCAALCSAARCAPFICLVRVGRHGGTHPDH